ncbi:Dps family protein [Flavobacterium sp. U410]|jgi:starvation-inducible DNA-binding protein
MRVNLGINPTDLQTSIDHLTVVLANEMLLYVKTRKFHWNVAGNSFMELHKIFENQYAKLALTADEIAERISALGGKTIGTMQEFIKHSVLEEKPNKQYVQSEMITELLEDHEKVIISLRDAIEQIENGKDFGTEDFLTSLLRNHEETAWILRKYLN